MKLWLLRHAAVQLEAGLCYGASDVVADPELTQQAASAVAPLLPPHLPVRVSGLGRAAQLATALAALRPDLPPAVVDIRLNEMHFGAWELQPWNAIPRTDFDRWMADFGQHRFGGVESAQMLLDRVASALEQQRREPTDDVLWITHAGVIRAVQYLLEHGARPIRDAAQWPKEAPATGGYVCLNL
jgi:alpha-ribazole phosphatase